MTAVSWSPPPPAPDAASSSPCAGVRQARPCPDRSALHVAVVAHGKGFFGADSHTRALIRLGKLRADALESMHGSTQQVADGAASLGGPPMGGTLAPRPPRHTTAAGTAKGSDETSPARTAQAHASPQSASAALSSSCVTIHCRPGRSTSSCHLRPRRAASSVASMLFASRRFPHLPLLRATAPARCGLACSTNLQSAARRRCSRGECPTADSQPERHAGHSSNGGDACTPSSVTLTGHSKSRAGAATPPSPSPKSSAHHSSSPSELVQPSARGRDAPSQSDCVEGAMSAGMSSEPSDEVAPPSSVTV